jgi:XRE family transcriptional regulator, regulator of sulfur utilization
MKDIYDNIKTLRKEKKISQEDMAIALDMFQANYGKLERGITELTISRLYKIAEILEVSVLDILGEKSKPLDSPDIESLSIENKILREDNKKWIAKIEDLEDDKRRLKSELEDYELLIFDNNMNFTFDKSIKALFVGSYFRHLMELFFERENDIKEGYQEDFASNRINQEFNNLMNLEEVSPLIDLILNNNKLLKSAIIQEDGRIDVALFRKEYNELLKNYKNEAKTK